MGLHTSVLLNYDFLWNCDFGNVECTNPDCIECLIEVENYDIQDQYYDASNEQEIQTPSIVQQGRLKSKTKISAQLFAKVSELVKK